MNKRISYIASLFAVDNEKINDVRESLKDDEKKYCIQLNPLEVQILQLLIKMNNVKKIVEIGTLAGYSSICMADALPEDGTIYTIEKNKDSAEMAKINFLKCNLASKITLINKNASEALCELSEMSPFDMVFIDADKSQYCKYLDWSENNIKTHGLIVADNTLLFNNVYEESYRLKGVSKTSWNVMRDFNLRLSDKSKYLSILIPTEDGMTIALKIS